MQFWINFKVDPKHSNKGTLTLLHITTGFHSVVVSMSDWHASNLGEGVFLFFLPNIQLPAVAYIRLPFYEAKVLF